MQLDSGAIAQRNIGALLSHRMILLDSTTMQLSNIIPFKIKIYIDLSKALVFIRFGTIESSNLGALLSNSMIFLGAIGVLLDNIVAFKIKSDVDSGITSMALK